MLNYLIKSHLIFFTEQNSFHQNIPYNFSFFFENLVIIFKKYRYYGLYFINSSIIRFNVHTNMRIISKFSADCIFNFRGYLM